jgi:hypothetical protein
MTAGVAKQAWENSRAQNGSLLLVMAIAFEFEAKGNCIMTVAELADKARLSERAVQSATADLARLGELTVTRRAEGHRNGYSLSMLRGAESAPLPAIKGADIAPPQNLHPAESAPLKREPAGHARGADSAGLEISNMLLTVTGSTPVPVKDVPAKPPRDDAERLCEHLANRIADDGTRRPVINAKWRDAARLLIDKDGRTEQQVHDAIDWCQDDEFWRANILSMPKLREKYDQLQKQAMRKSRPQAKDNSNLDVVARFMQRARNGTSQ